MQGASVGTVEFGRVLHFAVTNRDDAGAAIGGFTPAYFDVLDPETGELCLSNEPLRNETDRDLWFGTIDTSAAHTDWSGFETAHTYVLVVKSDTSENPTAMLTYNFTVTPSYSGKLDWLRNDVENVLFERLRRIIALCGENLVVDNFSYDTSGNIIGIRVRLFEDRASALAATPDITDIEPGELEQYNVTQQHNVARNVRTAHFSTISADSDDAPATENRRTDVVNAPGNVGDFPE